MKRCLVLIALAACSSKPGPIAKPADRTIEPPGDGQTAATKPPPLDVDVSPAPAPVQKETLATDTPRTTVAGNTFIAPAGWKIWVQGTATIVEAPEGDSRIALIDVKAK